VIKTGRVKFRDRVSRYGYVVADDASGPRDTFLFQSSDTSGGFESFSPGTPVQFEIDARDAGRRPRRVRLA
jgi:cold shock CspA family protein